MTARLSAIRLASGAAVLTDDFADWPGRYAFTGDALLVDAWSLVQPQIEAEHLGLWGTPETEQSPFLRSTRATGTYGVADGLLPNTFYFITIDTTWALGTGIDLAASFVGVYVNDAGFRPVQLPGPPLSPATIPLSAWGTTDSSGNLDVAFAVENVHPSFNINIVFGNLRMSTPAQEMADIFYDAGRVYVSGNQISITRGGVTFDPQEKWEDYEFPGKAAPVQGLDEVVESRPVLRTRMMLTGEYQFTVYRPGGTWSDGVVSQSRTYTLPAMRAALATGFYLADVIAVWPRARGDFVAVHFPIALVRQYNMGSLDKDEGGLDIVFEARIPTGEPNTTVPYRLHTYASGTVTPG